MRTASYAERSSLCQYYWGCPSKVQSMTAAAAPVVAPLSSAARVPLLRAERRLLLPSVSTWLIHSGTHSRLQQALHVLEPLAPALLPPSWAGEGEVFPA